MPHIKVAPFDKDSIDNNPSLKDILLFRANDGYEELWGVAFEGEEFLLTLKSEDEGNYLIKYDKVTRPLKVDTLKNAIATFADSLQLQILRSNIHSSKTKAPMASHYQKSIKDFEDIDFAGQKVSLEVGFGSGKHILHQALKNPNKLYIGIEIHTPSAQQLLKQIKLQNIQNIWVVNYDARLLLEMIDSNTLDEIYVHFPVPWDKKPHRRVISPSFLAQSMRALRVDGRLELRTDSDKYFWYALETFFAHPKIDVQVHKNRELEVVSKYEARWRRQDKDIYDVYVKCQEESEAIVRNYSFDFKPLTLHSALASKLPKEPQIFEGYFVHFERIYKATHNALLLKVAFGSFDRPEHKFIYVSNLEIRYMPARPVATSANALAHQKIEEFLDV